MFWMLNSTADPLSRSADWRLRSAPWRWSQEWRLTSSSCSWIGVLSMHPVVEVGVEVIELVHLTGSDCLLFIDTDERGHCTGVECGCLLYWPSAGQAWSTLCLDFLDDKIHRGRGDWIGLIWGSLRLFSLEPLQHRNCPVSVGVYLSVDVEPNGDGVALNSGYILAPTQSCRRRPWSGSCSACLSNISLARCR